MLLILGRTINLGRLTQALALGLVVFCAALLSACGDDQDTLATAEPQPAATSAAAPAGAQPTPEAPSPTTPPSDRTTTSTVAPTATPSSTTAPTETTTPSKPPIQVVTTTNFVADWARIIGGDRVEVFGLIPAGGDPHSFTPGARDIARVADADLVLTVGLRLEADWLTELVHNASADESKIVALGNSVDPMEFATAALHDDHDDHGDEHGEMMAADDHGEGEIMGRLLIGDGETAMMSVIDLEHGDVEQDVFDLGSRAGRIYATKNGRFAIAVASDANTVHVFDGGIYLEAHGDHFDLVEDDVERLGIDLSGDRPAHLYVGAEWATIFYDGSGDVAFLNEHELEEEGSAYLPPKLNFGAQHGAAVPLEGDLFAVSLQHPDYESDPAEYRLPIGAKSLTWTAISSIPPKAARDCTATLATDTWPYSAASAASWFWKSTVTISTTTSSDRRPARPRTSGSPPSGVIRALTISSAWARRWDCTLSNPRTAPWNRSSRRPRTSGPSTSP